MSNSKHKKLGHILSLPLILTALMICRVLSDASHAADRPNIIFFLIDDCSPQYLGCYGSEKGLTPNIDRLAAEGIRFKTTWACPLCHPSRVLLMSGQYGFKTGAYCNGIVDPAKAGYVPNQMAPLSRILQQAGYATFMGGKWHLGGMPSDPAWGFDEHCLYGSLCAAATENLSWRKRYRGPYWPWSDANGRVLSQWEKSSSPYATWHPMIIRNGTFVETGPNDFGPDILSDDAIKFMRRMQKNDQTFFMYYAEHLTHDPHPSMPDPDSPDGETKPGMESNVHYVDRIVGRLTDTLHELDLWENTVLIVASDNPMPGKGAASAIGARVPLIVAGGSRWIRWQGSTDCLTDFADIYPTCMALAGLDPASRPDLCGTSWKLLLDGDRSHTRPWIFSYVGGIHRMIRDRKWCLEGLGQLYRCNDSADPFTYELITKEKETAETGRARQALEARLVDLPAMPEALAAKNALASKSLELNRAGKLDKRQNNAVRSYKAGIEKLMNSKVRQIGPTRAQIEKRKM